MDLNSKLLREFWLDKTYGSWTGKIAGGTYAMPVEGKTRSYIQKLNPPFNGWGPLHHQAINDDEQYELIALLALESLSDAQFEERKSQHKLLSPDFLGSFWQKFLSPAYVFTAEKMALDNASKNKVPWEHAADEIFENRYQNAYFDWIGAQMKGEIFGMLSPAWGFHQNNSILPSEKTDLAIQLVLELSLQDAWMAHRGIGLVGELFVSLMVAIGIDFNPLTFRCEVKYPAIEGDDSPLHENIEQLGVTAELFKADLKRAEKILLEFAQNNKKLNTKDVEIYFSFIETIIRNHDKDPTPGKWGAVWEECERMAEKYFKDLEKDAYTRLNHNKEWLKSRLEVLEKNRWVHTVLNNAAIVLGLVYGDGDVFQTMRIATECGLDTDCNSGNATAIIGAYLGQRLIPMYVKRLIRNQIMPCVGNWEDLSLQNLANRTLQQALRLGKMN